MLVAEPYFTSMSALAALPRLCTSLLNSLSTPLQSAQRPVTSSTQSNYDVKPEPWKTSPGNHPCCQCGLLPSSQAHVHHAGLNLGAATIGLDPCYHYLAPRPPFHFIPPSFQPPATTHQHEHNTSHQPASQSMHCSCGHPGRARQHQYGFNQHTASHVNPTRVTSYFTSQARSSPHTCTSSAPTSIHFIRLIANTLCYVDGPLPSLVPTSQTAGTLHLQALNAARSNVQHCSRNNVQHCSHNNVQHCSHNNVQHCSHNNVQNCSHNNVQHRSYHSISTDPSCSRPLSNSERSVSNALQYGGACGTQRRLHRWLNPPSKRPTFDEHTLHPSVITRLIMEAESVQQLETTVQSYAEDFNHIHVVTALGRLAKLVDKSGRKHEDQTVQMLIDALSSAYLRFIDRYDARNLASGVWACSKLHYCPEDLLLEVMYQLMANGGGKLLEANPQTLATLASSFGQLHFEAREFWSMLAHVVEARARDFNPQDLAGTAWGFAKAHRYRLNLFELLANYAMLKMKDFNSHDMATIAWAFAQVGHIDHQLMTSLAVQAEARINSFLPHQLSILFWSYAKLHVSNPALYQALVKAVQSNIQHFNPQSLANVAWAHARMRMQNPELLKAIGKRSLEQPRLDNQAMATLVWAFARLGFSDPALLQKVSEQARTQAESLTPLDLVNVTWSLAQSGHHDKAYMKAAAVATLIKLPVLSSHHSTLLLWSFAKLGHYDVELFQEMCKHTRDKLLLFSAPQLAGILWSLGKVGHNDEDTIAAILKQLIPRLPALSKRDLMSTTLSLSRLRYADDSVWEALAGRVGDAAQEGQLVASEVARLIQCFIGVNYRKPNVYGQLATAAASLFSSRMFGPSECLMVLKNLEGYSEEEVVALSLLGLQEECVKCLEEQGLGLKEPQRRQAEQVLAAMAQQPVQRAAQALQPSGV